MTESLYLDNASVASLALLFAPPVHALQAQKLVRFREKIMVWVKMITS